jgi:hypothetical protein
MRFLEWFFEALCEADACGQTILSPLGRAGIFLALPGAGTAFKTDLRWPIRVHGREAVSRE